MMAWLIQSPACGAGQRLQDCAPISQQTPTPKSLGPKYIGQNSKFTYFASPYTPNSN